MPSPSNFKVKMCDKREDKATARADLATKMCSNYDTGIFLTNPEEVIYVMTKSLSYGVHPDGMLNIDHATSFSKGLSTLVIYASTKSFASLDSRNLSKLSLRQLYTTFEKVEPARKATSVG